MNFISYKEIKKMVKKASVKEISKVIYEAQKVIVSLRLKLDETREENELHLCAMRGFTKAVADVLTEKESLPEIDQVIFSNEATVILWKDHTKTIAKCSPEDENSKIAGFAVAYAKKFSGNQKFREDSMKYCCEVKEVKEAKVAKEDKEDEAGATA